MRNHKNNDNENENENLERDGEVLIPKINRMQRLNSNKRASN